MNDADRLDALEHATRTMRAALDALRAGDDERAGELLDDLEERDPIRAPLSRPPEPYSDFFADYRRRQLDIEEHIAGRSADQGPK